MRLIIRLFVNMLALFIVAYLVPGFRFDGFTSILVTAIVIGIVNTLIKPILQLIALPISILTLGLFALVINVLLLYAVSFLVPGFSITSFTSAFISSILLGLVTWFLHKLATN